jgi:hypothetical protein
MFYLLKQASTKAKPITRFFAINSEVKEDGPHTLAKMVVSDNTRYFCKFNTHGVEAGHLVNPWSMYAEENPNFTNAINARTGKALHEYKEVSETIFNLYVKYLSSRSDVHYRQAERMALENG